MNTARRLWIRHAVAAALAAAAVGARAQVDAHYRATYLEHSKGWGVIVADFDRDGHDDVYNTGHDPDDRIWYWTPTGYVPGPQVQPYVDRHGCAAADMNRDGLLDMYCAVGAVKGTGAADNEMWLQSKTGVFTRLAPFGAEDAYGRSRRPVFLDLDHDGWPDLYTTVQPTDRDDGQPNINHMYMNQGGTGFVEKVTIATGKRGFFCAVKGDIDGDGWDDLGVCHDNQHGGHLYINDHHADFTELATPATVVPWTDAKLVDVNGDGRDDLVLTNTQGFFQIWLNAGKAPYYPAVSWQYKLPDDGVSVAMGDFDGDGTKDFYVVLDDPACGKTMVDLAPDLVFWGQANGGYAVQAQPQSGLLGCGHLAATIDGDKILLEQGTEGDQAGTYVLRWKR